MRGLEGRANNSQLSRGLVKATTTSQSDAWPQKAAPTED